MSLLPLQEISLQLAPMADDTGFVVNLLSTQDAPEPQAVVDDLDARSIVGGAWS